MDVKNLANTIKQEVSILYWKDDKNCATTVLCILSKLFRIQLTNQTIDAALAMHGAGKYGGQCGLVEGAIMFMGIFGRRNKIEDRLTIASCRDYAAKFEARFGSLSCRALRPKGFGSDNPPHLCEQITCEATEFAARHVSTYAKDNGVHTDNAKERSLSDSLLCRQAFKADLPGILRLYAQPDIDNGKVLSLHEAEHFFERIASYPDYHLYVAVCGEHIIGTFALLVMENLGHLGASSAIIEDVAVDPEWQGRGVGKMMMGYALQKCREKGCYKAVLSSNLKRDKAHTFYESIGFARHGYSFQVDSQPDTESND